ncbi:MAG: hypothetical protein IKD93_05085 [Firmicutes bacterium]|nr:hypothetical protein [Bacillota bacterium]
MKFSELTELFAAYTGAEDQADNARLALWFNEAQLDLAYDLGPVSVREIAAEPGFRLHPEADWLCVAGCELDYIREADGSLLFPAGGRGRLFFRRLPQAFSGTDGDQESELPRAVHYLLAVFAAARYWDLESEGDGEESAHAGKWLGYYYQGRNLARSRLPGVYNDLRGWRVV